MVSLHAPGRSLQELRNWVGLACPNKHVLKHATTWLVAEKAVETMNNSKTLVKSKIGVSALVYTGAIILG